MSSAPAQGNVAAHLPLNDVAFAGFSSAGLQWKQLLHRHMSPAGFRICPAQAVYEHATGSDDLKEEKEENNKSG